MVRKKISTTAALLLLLTSKTNFAEVQKSTEKNLLKTNSTITVSYPLAPIAENAGWEEYFSEVLTLALSKVTEPHNLQSITMETHSQTRAERLLEENVVSIHWLHTNIQRERTLLPIRIPLLKGLIGWRVFLVHQSKVDKYKNVTTLEKLKELNILQGIDWPDTEILKDNGFSIRTSRNTENLIRMLKHGRGDYFPRSIVEIWKELQDYSDMGLAVEKKLVLQYPTAYYFFTSKNTPEVKELVEKGMNLAIFDGSFDKLFMKHFGDMISRSNLHDRKVLPLKNLLLPSETPLSRTELWFSVPTKTE